MLNGSGATKAPRMSSSFAVVLTAACVGIGVGLVAAYGNGGVNFQGLPILLPLLVLYPFVVATLMRQSGSQIAVPGIGAVLPAISAAALAVHAPYTWRDVVAPLAIGAVALVSFWIAAAVLARVPARRVWTLGIVIGGALAVVAWFFVGVLLLQGTTNAAPF